MLFVEREAKDIERKKKIISVLNAFYWLPFTEFVDIAWWLDARWFNLVKYFFSTVSLDIYHVFSAWTSTLGPSEVIPIPRSLIAARQSMQITPGGITNGTALVASLRCNDLEDALEADLGVLNSLWEDASRSSNQICLAKSELLALENTDGELRALRNFPLASISLFVKRKRCLAPGCRVDVIANMIERGTKAIRS